jgi:hypothetical protein
VPPQNVQAGRAPDLDPVVLEVGLEGAVVRHDYDKMSVPFVDGLAEGGEVGPCCGPPAVVGGGQVQQQLVTGPYQSGVVEGELVLLTGREFAEDTTVPVVFVQQYAGHGRPADARDTVQDDGAGVGEHGTSLAHARRSDQYVAKSAELVLGDSAESLFVRVPQLHADVDVAVARYRDARVPDPGVGALDHRSLSS